VTRHEADESKKRPRVAAIDVMRGFVMVLMSIDHASEAFNRGRLMTDGVRMYRPGTELPFDQFMTRWITHLCAPTFVALAGAALAMSVEARKSRGESPWEIDRHVLVRGLLLVVFEVLWMSWAMMDAWGRFLFQVLYAIGASLVCMPLLRRLGDRAMVAVGLALALGSEVVIGAFMAAGLVDRIPTALLSTGGWFFGGKLVIAYPLLPWLGMMCLGWAFGRRMVKWRAEGKDEAAEASRLLVIAGAIGLSLFVALRAANGFGNMRLLRESGGLVQWLHVSKYPPSATYVGLELGIAALILAALFRWGSRALRALEPLRLLGQTALFYYLLHIHVLKLAAWSTGLEGRLGVGSAYLGALGVLVALYPACAWYRRYKAAHPNGWARWI